MVRGKIGAAHFEMIIGFVFFVGFVMFLFLFLSPWDNSSLPKSALSGLHISFLEKVNTNLSSVFVDARGVPSPPGQCFWIDLPDEIFEYVSTDDKSLVKKLGGISISSDLAGNRLNLDSSEGDFFRIAISPEFSSENVSCSIKHPGFKLGSVVEMKIVSYSKLGTMKSIYYADYDGLKDELKVAGIFDFAIVFEGLPEMSMEPTAKISGVVEILAKEYIVKVLKSNGEISNERVSIRIW